MGAPDKAIVLTPTLLASVPGGSLRNKIDALEALMLREPQVAIEPVHYFAKGL